VSGTGWVEHKKNLLYRQCLHGLWASIIVGQLIFKHENRETYIFYSFSHPCQSLPIGPGHGLQDPGHGLHTVLATLLSLFLDGDMYRMILHRKVDEPE
jgi:hypothetical protein